MATSPDSAFVFEAMDVPFAGHVDGFCIASSCGDFTRLTKRLRGAGKAVHGWVERKTPDASGFVHMHVRLRHA